MVNRIQNRNTGYSDFSNFGPNRSFNFSNDNSSPVSHGANALKLENEIISENVSDSINEVNNEYVEELVKNQEVENVVNNSLNESEVSFTQEALETQESNQEDLSHNLKEFGVDTDEPDLFSSSQKDSSLDDSSNFFDEKDEEDDDLEIPAFLRRQKN